jgi:cell division protein FtsA
MKYVTTGIDIGTESLRICLLENDTKENTQNVVGFFKYPVGGVHKGHVTNELAFKQSLQRALKDIHAQMGFKVESAAISTASASLESLLASQNGIVSKIDSEITAFDIENIERQLGESVEQKSRKIIYSSIVEFKLDGKVTHENPEGQKGIKLEIKKLFTSIALLQYDLLDTVFYENNVEMTHIYPKGISASKEALSEKMKVVGVGYLDIGAETTTLTVYENGLIIGYSLIPVGSNHITNDIALGLRISLEEADQVKQGTSQHIYPRKKVDDIINSRLEDICELVNTYLKKIKRNELLPGGLVLNGGGTEVVGIEEQLRQSLKLPIKKVTFEVTTQKKGSVRQSEFLECYGLALLAHETESSSNSSKHGSLLDKIKKSSSSFLKQFLP